MLPSVFVATVFAAVTPVDPPEAAFTLADGRLGVRVTHAGQPTGGVTVRCLVGREVWAIGDTDADGRTSLPQPPEDWCQVVCDLGDGPTAPIPLTLLPPDEVVPKTYPVLDGAAECCLVPRRLPVTMPPPSPPAANSPLELLSALGLGAVIAGLALAVWRWRTARRPV